MNGIKDIIESGKPPGYFGSAVDPQSVFAAAPKAFREIERGEGRSRAQGPISARDMAKYMGLGSVDRLKAIWKKTNSKAFGAIAALCLLSQSMFGQSQLFSIPAPYPIVDGVYMHAANFNNAMQFLQPTPFFITSWPVDSTPLTGDQLLVYSQNGAYQRLSVGTLLSSGAPIVLYPSGTPSVNTNDLFSFFSQSQQALNSIAFTNLVALILSFQNFTNLAADALPISGLSSNALTKVANTNFPSLMDWRTNGVPLAVTLGTLENAIGSDSLYQPYNYDFTFIPYNFYPTNSTPNPWGLFTNFPITSLQKSGTNLNTLADADTLPINSTTQLTNTTVNLEAIYEYFTNRNALPFYTQARIQFSGVPDTLFITNNADTVNNLIQVTTNTFTPGLIYAVDVSTNGNTQKFWSTIQSNQVYWVVSKATNNTWVSVFTNFSNAVFGTNSLTITATGSGTQCKMYYLTNFSSFNADETVVTAGNSVITGYYDTWFRTPSSTPFYYTFGTAEQVSASHTVIFSIGFDNLITTSMVRTTFMNDLATYVQPNFANILISPQ